MCLCLFFSSSVNLEMIVKFYFQDDFIFSYVQMNCLMVTYCLCAIISN